MSIQQSFIQDERAQKLIEWLDQTLDEKYTLTIASADASFRRYFRIAINSRTLIAMDAPPEQEALSPFFEIATDWKSAGIMTPEIYSKSSELGFMLLEDFGDITLLKYLDDSNADELKKIYKQALSQLIVLQKTNSTHLNQQYSLPNYSRERLLNECELFREWYLRKHCHYQISEEDNLYLDRLFTLLAENALGQDKVSVHRDYHSRNLMVLENSNSLGVIDFQDAVHGPLYYDAVSLLKDCYKKLGVTVREELLHFYYQQLRTENLTHDTFQAVQKQFTLMGVQRHLKAIGIFCRLWHRDGKDSYLNDIPLTASYLTDLRHNVPELDRLNAMLDVTLSESF